MVNSSTWKLLFFQKDAVLQKHRVPNGQRRVATCKPGLTSFSETLALFFIQFPSCRKMKVQDRQNGPSGLPEKTGWLRAWANSSTRKMLFYANIQVLVAVLTETTYWCMPNVHVHKGHWTIWSPKCILFSAQTYILPSFWQPKVALGLGIRINALIRKTYFSNSCIKYIMYCKPHVKCIFSSLINYICYTVFLKLGRSFSSHIRVWIYY